MLFINNQEIFDKIVLTSDEITGITRMGLLLIDTRENKFSAMNMFSEQMGVHCRPRLDNWNEQKVNLVYLVNGIKTKKVLNLTQGNYLGVSIDPWDEFKVKCVLQARPFEYDKTLASSSVE